MRKLTCTRTTTSPVRSGLSHVSEVTFSSFQDRVRRLPSGPGGAEPEAQRRRLAAQTGAGPEGLPEPEGEVPEGPRRPVGQSQAAGGEQGNQEVTVHDWEMGGVADVRSPLSLLHACRSKSSITSCGCSTAPSQPTAYRVTVSCSKTSGRAEEPSAAPPGWRTVREGLRRGGGAFGKFY